MADMREFVRSLPNCAVLDDKQRKAAETEIEQRVGALSAGDRAKFESELRTMAHEQHRNMSFSQKWADAQRAQQLRKQITQGGGEK